MKYALAASGLLLLAVLAVGCGQPAKPAAPVAAPAATSSTPTQAEPGAVGMTAPELQGKSWLTADGKAPALKDKVYLLEFWSVT